MKTELLDRTKINVNLDRFRVAGRNVWLAGLGAFSQAEQEGREIFDKLVERGRQVESRQLEKLDHTVERASDQIKDWGDRIEDTVQGGLKGLLHRVGLPSRQDLDHLSSRLSTLSQKVERVTTPRAH